MERGKRRGEKCKGVLLLVQLLIIGISSLIAVQPGYILFAGKITAVAAVLCICLAITTCYFQWEEGLGFPCEKMVLLQCTVLAGVAVAQLWVEKQRTYQVYVGPINGVAIGCCVLSFLLWIRQWRQSPTPEQQPLQPTTITS